jgi:hypothetical protein
MLHLSKGVIHLDDSSNENVGSDVEEVIQWDRSLRLTKMLQMVVLILSSHKFEPPNLKWLQKIFLMFKDNHTCN